jgi:3-dehydro-L-gulonate 2-dehydrogenase
MTVTYEQLKNEFKRVLLTHSFTEEKAELCSRIFADNSLDGVYSHGVNRFPVFVDYIKKGWIKTSSEPEKIGGWGVIEQWDGGLAPGMYTASICMSRAIELARQHGIGAVAVKNTNHWMRGGTYGWQAAEARFIGICMTNTIANMPPWGGTEPRLGNNPLIIAIPRKNGHVVLDMAQSQYSYGKLQEYQLSGKALPLPGGYNAQGNLTTDPARILQTKRVIPAGYWKGSGLSLVIDLLVTGLSGGNSTADITKAGPEIALSQFFLCIRPDQFNEEALEEIISFTKSSTPADKNGLIQYPGERTLITRQKNQKEGIPVNDEIWNRILAL